MASPLRRHLKREDDPALAEAVADSFKRRHRAAAAAALLSSLIPALPTLRHFLSMGDGAALAAAMGDCAIDGLRGLGTLRGKQLDLIERANLRLRAGGQALLRLERADGPAAGAAASSSVAQPGSRPRHARAVLRITRLAAELSAAEDVGERAAVEELVRLAADTSTMRRARIKILVKERNKERARRHLSPIVVDPERAHGGRKLSSRIVDDYVNKRSGAYADEVLWKLATLQDLDEFKDPEDAIDYFDSLVSSGTCFETAYGRTRQMFQDDEPFPGNPFGQFMDNDYDSCMFLFPFHDSPEPYFDLLVPGGSLAHHTC